MLLSLSPLPMVAVALHQTVMLWFCVAFVVLFVLQLIVTQCTRKAERAVPVVVSSDLQLTKSGSLNM